MITARRKKKERRKEIGRRLSLAKKNKAKQLEAENVDVPIADVKNKTRSAESRLQNKQNSKEEEEEQIQQSRLQREHAEQQNKEISVQTPSCETEVIGSEGTSDKAAETQINIAYSNLHSLITAAATAPQGSQYNSVLSLARAVKQQGSKDDTSVTQTTSCEEEESSTMISLQLADDSQPAAPNPTLVRMSLFRVVQDETGEDDTAILHEGGSLVTAQKAHYVIKHLLNTVMCQLASNQLKLITSAQPSSVTPTSNDVSPAQSNSTASPNSKSSSTSNSEPSSIPHSTIPNSKPSSTPNSKPSSISNLQTVTKAQAIVNPLSVTSAQPAGEQTSKPPPLRFTEG